MTTKNRRTGRADSARLHNGVIEALEGRQYLSFAEKINFQPASPGNLQPPAGYLLDTGGAYAQRGGLYYGWRIGELPAADTATGYSKLQSSSSDWRFNDARYMTWEGKRLP